MEVNILVVLIGEVEAEILQVTLIIILITQTIQIPMQIAIIMVKAV